MCFQKGEGDLGGEASLSDQFSGFALTLLNDFNAHGFTSFPALVAPSGPLPKRTGPVSVFVWEKQRQNAAGAIVVKRIVCTELIGFIVEVELPPDGFATHLH